MIYGKIKQVTFSITYVDEVSTNQKDFETLDELIAFVKANPEISTVVNLPKFK